MRLPLIHLQIDLGVAAEETFAIIQIFNCRRRAIRYILLRKRHKDIAAIANTKFGETTQIYKIKQKLISKF